MNNAFKEQVGIIIKTVKFKVLLYSLFSRPYPITYMHNQIYKKPINTV